MSKPHGGRELRSNALVVGVLLHLTAEFLDIGLHGKPIIVVDGNMGEPEIHYYDVRRCCAVIAHLRICPGGVAKFTNSVVVLTQIVITHL